jgi:hypothetical protein
MVSHGAPANPLRFPVALLGLPAPAEGRVCPGERHLSGPGTRPYSYPSVVGSEVDGGWQRIPLAARDDKRRVSTLPIPARTSGLRGCVFNRIATSTTIGYQHERLRTSPARAQPVGPDGFNQAVCNVWLPASLSAAWRQRPRPETQRQAAPLAASLGGGRAPLQDGRGRPAPSYGTRSRALS